MQDPNCNIIYKNISFVQERHQKQHVGAILGALSEPLDRTQTFIYVQKLSPGQTSTTFLVHTHGGDAALDWQLLLCSRMCCSRRMYLAVQKHDHGKNDGGLTARTYRQNWAATCQAALAPSFVFFSVPMPSTSRFAAVYSSSLFQAMKIKDCRLGHLGTLQSK